MNNSTAGLVQMTYHLEVLSIQKGNKLPMSGRGCGALLGPQGFYAGLHPIRPASHSAHARRAHRI